MIKIIIKGSLSFIIKKEKKYATNLWLPFPYEISIPQALVQMVKSQQAAGFYSSYAYTLPMFLAIKYVNIDKHVMRA